MTWQNLLPSSLGNPSSNKKFLSTKEVESKSPNPTSSAPCPKFEQLPTDIKEGVFSCHGDEGLSCLRGENLLPKKQKSSARNFPPFWVKSKKELGRILATFRPAIWGDIDNNFCPLLTKKEPRERIRSPSSSIFVPSPLPPQAFIPSLWREGK